MRNGLVKLGWVLRLAFGKMLEGPGPWLRAARRGVLGLLPTPWQVRLIRWRYRLPEADPQGLEIQNSQVEQSGLVSVILPVFNQADLLAESIESVLAQTYADLELILLNDGSTDGVDTVFAQFGADPRVRILTQPNRKLPVALTNAFRFARGEYRTWTSADNVMEPEHLAELVRFLQARPRVAMVYADYRVIGSDGEFLSGSDFRPQNRATSASCEIRLPRHAAGLDVVQDNFIGACFLYRGWVGRLIGDYSSSLGIEDYDYWMRIHAEFGIEHLGTDALLYRYRWHDNSLNARATEIRLYEVGQQLMEHERQRARWRAESWQVLLHESQAWAKGLQVPRATLQAYRGDAADHDTQQLLMIAASAVEPPHLEEMLGDVVAMEWEDAAEVYEFAEQLRNPRLLHFAEDPGVLAALALFTDAAFELGRTTDRIELALSFGNERICHQRSSITQSPPLPDVWSAPGSCRRLLVQVASADQGGLESAVMDQVLALSSEGFEIVVLALGDAVNTANHTGLPMAPLTAPTAAAYGEMLKAAQIDLVLAHHSVFGAEAAADLGIPFVQLLEDARARPCADELVEWRAAEDATAAYLALSNRMAQVAHLGLGLCPAKTVVLKAETETLARVLMWLQDGGHPSAARPFAW